MPQSPPLTLKSVLDPRAIYTPGITPEQLEAAGEFLLTDYTARNALVPEFKGFLTFGIFPLEGEIAGVEHTLSLVATNVRRRIGLLILDAGRVGPCVLTRTRVDAVTTLWEFGESDGAGGIWTPHRALYAEYVPRPGDLIPVPQ